MASLVSPRSLVLRSPFAVDDVQPRAFWTRGLELTLGAILLLNLIDLCATVFLVNAGFATEANPIMNQAFEGGTFVFAICKLAMVSAGVGVLFHYRHRRLAALGTLATFGAYASVCAYHAHLFHCLTDQCTSLSAIL